ncbi:YSIRK-type signal peptide-containing protein [Lactobacillus gasseri]|nr:YSIRK-type signal peptide-containing protein [Lactobacillus gasseri]
MSSNMFGDKHNHYSIRKLSVGAASVLIGATIYLGGVNAQAVRADSVNEDATEQVEKKDEANVKAAEVKTTEQKQENNKTAVSATNENARQNVAETTSGSKKVASNRDVNVTKNDVTTDKKEVKNSEIVDNSKDMNTTTAEIHSLGVKVVSAQALEESKAATDSSLSTGMTADEYEKIIGDKSNYFSYTDVANHVLRKVSRTVIMHKPTGDGTISQFGSVRSINGFSTLQGWPTEYRNHLTIATIINNNGKTTHKWVYQNNVYAESSDGGRTTFFKSAADKEAYEKFMAFAANPDIKVTLPAIDQSQFKVDGYTYTISPANSNLGDWTFDPLNANSVEIEVNYKKVNTVTYKFEDPFGNQVGNLVPVTGAVGSNQAVSLTLPAGYQLALGTLPTSVTIPDSDKTISIPVKHQLTISLSGSSEVDYGRPDWVDLVKNGDIPVSGYEVHFNDDNARVYLSSGTELTFGTKEGNVGTYKVSLTEQGLKDIKQQLGDDFIYPDLKDITSTAKLTINKGRKEFALMGGTEKIYDGTTTLPDNYLDTFGLADDAGSSMSVYKPDGTKVTITLKQDDVRLRDNSKPINVGKNDVVLSDEFINNLKKITNNNYEFNSDDISTATYAIYQATGKAKLSGDNSKLYDGNAVTTTEVNNNGKITIDLTLPVYKQAAEPGDEPKLLRIVDLGKYTLQDGDYTWNTADGSAPTKGGSYTISLNKDKILSHLQDRLKTLAGVGTDPDSEDPDNPTPMDNVTVSAEDLAGIANYDINTSVSYQFIDIDNNNSKVGAPGVVTGLNGESTDVSLDVPKGYELVDVLPTKATFGDINQTISINLKHKKTSVDGRNHKDDNDIYRTVTRTITVNIEGQPTQDISQEVSLYRIKTVDEALKAAGKPESEYTTYSAWTSNMSDGSTSFATVSVPADGNGYVRSITGGTIEKDKVTEQSALNNGEPAKDITVTVNYAKAEQTTTVTYVDKDGNEIKMPDGQPVAGSHYEISGKTGDTVNTDVKDKVPAGWEIIPGTKYPTTVTFGSTPTSPIKVKVEHKITKTDGRDHKDKQDLYREVTRTILMNVPNATGQGKETETLNFYRVKTVDEALKAVGESESVYTTYSNWASDVTGSKTTFDEFNVSKTNDGKEIAAGYTPTSEDVTLETKNGDKVVPSQSALKNGVPVDSFVVEVAYTPNAQKTTVTYVDENDKEITNPDGSVIPGSHYDVTGVTNKKVDTNIQKNVPTNWHITDPEVPATITFGADGHTPITVHVAHNTKPVDKNDVPDNYKESDFSKTIKRTITAKEPNKDVDLSQEIELTRTGTYDEVTGETKYSDWTTGKFDEVKAPEVAGYTPSQAKVDGVDKVTVDYVDPNVVITYIEDPVGQDITVKKGDTPDPEDGVKNHGDLDKITDPKHPGTKTTYTWKKTPDTSVPGDVPATVVVHYPDGSNKPVDITVHVVDDTPVVPTKNPDPTGQEPR